MSDYYKATATIQEPRYLTAPPRKPQPSQPPQQYPNDELPTETSSPLTSPPPEPATIQRPPRPRVEQTPGQQYGTGGQLKAAPVNATLRQRCQGVERILRRLLPLILLFFYSLFGGMLFHLVEKQHETETLRQGSPGRAVIDEPEAVQLNKRFTEIVLDANYTRDRRSYEVKQALIWYFNVLDNRWSTIHGVEKTKWDFVSALFYSVSVYTTIGYGKPAPATTAGQVLTVFYALVGVPLALLSLVQLGFILACAIKKLWSIIRHGTNRSSRGSDWQAVPATESESRFRQERDDLDTLTFPVSTVVLFAILWMLFTALLFYEWEKPRWSYGESFYFTFISLSTIGLGDYKPWSGWGKLAGAILLILGLALLATIFALFLYQLEALYRCMERAIDAEYRQSLTDQGEPMATNPLTTDDALKRMASRLPFGSRCLYWALPEGRKRSLRKLYTSKARLSTRGMQTDDYLWAMSPVGIQPLKTIGEEGHDSRSLKSRDDVNSLVAMCDYSLHPSYRGTKLEY